MKLKGQEFGCFPQEGCFTKEDSATSGRIESLFSIVAKRDDGS
jgi:hypothetical protein